MNIWTERLEKRHLPLLERWIGRREGALTLNDLPAEPGELALWFEQCAAEPGRLDCLARVYETPVGIAGLLQSDGQQNTAAFYLLLGEKNYNPLRTATYITLRMLDRAFLDMGFGRVSVRVPAHQGWYLEPLERMGFSRESESSACLCLAVQKDTFQNRKYLF